MAKNTFILSDESVNDFGFRILTDGIDLTRFKKNPIMLYGHIRAFEGKGKDGTILPIGRWENIRKKDGQLLADAVFDEDDKFAMKVASKVDKGILNAASSGLDLTEYSEDPKLMKKGQVLPTITKSVLKEGSIADVPGNGNAVKLYGKEVTVSIGLSDSNPQDLDKLFLLNKPDTTMKFLIAGINKHAQLSGINLAEGADEAQINSAIEAIVSKLQTSISDKDKEIAELTSKKTELEGMLKTQKEQAHKDKATALVEAALTAQKIVAGQKDQYLALASASEEGYESVKKIFDGMKGHQPISQQLNSGGNANSGDQTELKDEWDKAFQNGTLESIKLHSPDRYKELYKAKWNKEPVEA
ncbi:MAG: hypothetical protein ACFB2Y_16935 [Fulvivirga sp.]